MGGGYSVGPGVLPLQVHRRHRHRESVRLRVRVRRSARRRIPVHRFAAHSVPGRVYGVVLCRAGVGGAGGTGVCSVDNGVGLGCRGDEGLVGDQRGLRCRRRSLGEFLPAGVA